MSLKHVSHHAMYEERLSVSLLPISHAATCKILLYWRLQGPFTTSQCGFSFKAPLVHRPLPARVGVPHHVLTVVCFVSFAKQVISVANGWGRSLFPRDVPSSTCFLCQVTLDDHSTFWGEGMSSTAYADFKQRKISLCDVQSLLSMVQASSLCRWLQGRLSCPTFWLTQCHGGTRVAVYMEAYGYWQRHRSGRSKLLCGEFSQSC